MGFKKLKLRSNLLLNEVSVIPFNRVVHISGEATGLKPGPVFLLVDEEKKLLKIEPNPKGDRKLFLVNKNSTTLAFSSKEVFGVFDLPEKNARYPFTKDKSGAVIIDFSPDKRIEKLVKK